MDDDQISSTTSQSNVIYKNICMCTSLLNYRDINMRLFMIRKRTRVPSWVHKQGYIGKALILCFSCILCRIVGLPSRTCYKTELMLKQHIAEKMTIIARAPYLVNQKD